MCPNCKGTLFEIQEFPVTNSSFKRLFINCSLCGNAVGIASHIEPSAVIEKLSKDVGDMKRDINNRLDKIDGKLRS